MKKKTVKVSRGQKAFSLVEMLVVIAVIGIIATIAVPNIGRIKTTAENGKSMRTAENIASVYTAAQAAGYTFTNIDRVEDAIDVIAEGVEIKEKDNPFNGTIFWIPELKNQPEKKSGATRYLVLSDGALYYSPKKAAN